MQLRTTLATCLVCFAGSVGAADLELALSSESANLRLISDSALVGSGGGDMGVGILYNEADDIMLDLSLLVQGRPAGEQPLTFGLGGKIIYASIDAADEGALGVALGGKVAYHIPSNTPVALSAEFFYAPKITTFGEGKDIIDALARIEVDVLPAATAFLGYRSVTVDLDKFGKFDLDDNVHLGMRFQF